MLTQKEVDSLDVLRPVSMVVKPEFYVRWARWAAHFQLEPVEVLWPNAACLDKIASTARVLTANDGEIITGRLGDGYEYRGITVRLDEPEVVLPSDTSYEVRFTY